MAMTTNSLDHGFACCEMMLHGHYLEIRLVINPLIPTNASIGERVRTMQDRRERLIEECNTCYVHFLDQ